MKKLIIGAGSVGAAAVSMALFGTGVAAADDYAGQTYADAASAISDSGGTAVVATRVGGRLPQDECLVTNSWGGSFLRDVGGGEMGFASGEVMLALNCNGDHATATHAGASVASPAGREAKAAADEAAAAEAEELAAVSTPDE